MFRQTKIKWTSPAAGGRAGAGELNRRAIGFVVAVWALLEIGMVFGGLTPPAFASSVSGAGFSGGTGTAVVSGTLYAKQGQSVTLSVTTSSDTKCVEITGAHTAQQTSSSAKSSWTFSFTAGAGDGVKTVTAAASPSFNTNNNCTGQTGTRAASYVLDNTGPAVAATLAPAPNAAGWSNKNVALTWGATDSGSGVKTGPNPASDGVTSETGGVTRNATATDNVGNSGTGSAVIKLDKTAPAITASRSPAPNGFGWNNTDVTVSFACSDALSGIKSCPGGGSVPVPTEGTDQSVTGKAVDNADNESNGAVSGINIDKTKPTLTGAATTQPNAAGWYDGDVAIAWSADDDRSGIRATPANSVLAGEGANLTATATVSDKAGNETSATSRPVSIDRTAPVTTATATGGEWNNVDVAVTLDRSDQLSGIETTRYTINGGQAQTYDPSDKPSFSQTGVYTLGYWSVDKAGNAEAPKSIRVKIDKTTPTIGHAFDPDANPAEWHRSDVTVSFQCGDEGGSGIKSCSTPVEVTTEGRAQRVTGTAEDNAGNTAVDAVDLNIDRTAPQIRATADRAVNADGWYDADVTVDFICSDALSGVAECPTSQTVGEGAGQSASGTATDVAGNTASDKVTGINVDKTAPTLTAGTTTSPNGGGWYAGDVTVEWHCEDTLAGVAGSCPEDSVIEGEGDNLSAAAAISDKAGNRVTRTLDGIKIDRTAPGTVAEVEKPLASGWYASGVQVALTGTDALSGVDATYYAVDGGDAQKYEGPFTHVLPGRHTISFWSVDRAGNAEQREANVITLKIDDIAPSIAGSRVPAPNAHGWNNTDVTVSFGCEDAESGVASCSPHVPLTDEGANQQATGNAVDLAGNGAETTVTDINIDKTAPVLTGVPTRSANAAGWYKGDVTVKWTAEDGLSGIDPANVPADSEVTGEGADLSTGEVSVSDKAGNRTTASKGGIKIDRTAPGIAGAPTTRPNADGWYSGDVTVAYTCTDDLSGLANCPSDSVLRSNGASQSVTSDPAEDLAGNVAAGRTVGGINIDGLPPQTTADNQCSRLNNWCTGSTADVVLTATDQTGLSGVKEIRYSVNGGAEQVAAGSARTISVPLDGSGEAAVRFYAVDKAGNAEPMNGMALKYDNIAPTVSHTLTPAPNADEWNSSDVRVHFDAKDNDGGSGVDQSRTTADVVVSEETAGREIAGEAYDVAGNRGTDKVTVKLDKTGPTVEGEIVEGTMGENGWYVGPVTVRWSCGDALSGVAVCPTEEIVNTNGADQKVKGTAIDRAGNKTTASLSGIHIDHEKPAISFSDTKAIQTLGNVTKPTCTATDRVSGLRSCAVEITGGTLNGVGQFTATATATDNAGNVSTAAMTYSVIYRWDGFRQPITDTAHQQGSVSVFKSGSTVPVKYQLKKADGTVVKAASAGAWLQPVQGGANLAPASVDSIPAGPSSSLGYRWDDSGQQYIYNWGTPKGSSSAWRIGVTLDDGQTYSVAIALR